MLVETLAVALGTAASNARIDITKDVSILTIDCQPVVQQRTTFKKSSTLSHCLAASTSHIFAAQADKAVVHVYNRSKGNQEATVAFPEKIACLTLAYDDTILALGTAEGRVYLWELATGRQITTAQAHLQTLTCLATDGTYLVSTSADTTARVWSLPDLLSFQADLTSSTTNRIFDSHSSAITAVALGHSASLQNLAITIAQDKTCLIWDYHSCTTVLTFLLAGVPTCIDFDPADRATYVGFQDGSVQQLDLMALAKTRSGKDANSAIQPGDSRRWRIADTSCGAALTLAVSFDGTTVTTGHQSGAIISWDVANGHTRHLPLQAPITRPVTVLQYLPVTGAVSQKPAYLIETVVKPRFGAFQTASGSVPGNYAAQLHLLPAPAESAFRNALSAPTIPQDWIDQGLQELNSWSQPVQTNGDQHNDDFMALETKDQSGDLQQQNSELKKQLEALRRVQNASFDRIEKLSAERKALLQREQQRMLHQADNGDDD